MEPSSATLSPYLNEVIAFEINSWIRHMHDPKNHRQHPGWRSLEVAIRLKIWVDTFDSFLHSPLCDPGTYLTALIPFRANTELPAVKVKFADDSRRNIVFCADGRDRRIRLDQDNMLPTEIQPESEI